MLRGLLRNVTDDMGAYVFAFNDAAIIPGGDGQPEESPYERYLETCTIRAQNCIASESPGATEVMGCSGRCG